MDYNTEYWKREHCGELILKEAMCGHILRICNEGIAQC